MKTHPILFSTAMVRAILEGQKSQTRRIVRDQDRLLFQPVSGCQEQDDPDNWLWEYKNGWWESLGRNSFDGINVRPRPSPYGTEGDQLWVRETWGARFCHNDLGVVAHHWNDLRGKYGSYRTEENAVITAYKAAGHNIGGWVPSIHMPRWASRITLEITDIRVERLNDISADDCRVEGHVPRADMSQEANNDAARDWYQDLWIQINGLESWKANPWVWVIEFKRVPQEGGKA